MNGLYSALQIYDPSRVHTPQYDTAGELTSLTSPDPDGATGPLPAAVVQYEYDTSRRVIRQTLPENRTTLFSYDDAGRIQTVTQSDLSLRRFQPQQTLGWVNPTGGLGTSDRPAPLYRDGAPMGFQVNELGQQSRWRTDRFGFLIRQQTSLGTVTLIERDANGLPTRQIAPDPMTPVRSVLPKPAGVTTPVATWWNWSSPTVPCSSGRTTPRSTGPPNGPTPRGRPGDPATTPAGIS
jgi:YD repeat-containing protein